MKTTSAITPGGRALWLLLLVASAAAMTNYLCDPNGVPLSGGIWICVAAWATVVCAWRFHRCHLPEGFQSGPRVLGIVLIELIAVVVVRTNFFACPPPPLPPSSQAVCQYLFLTEAIQINDLNSVKRILASGINPNYVPSQWEICQAVEQGKNVPWESGDLPFDKAFLQGEVAITAALLDHGASPVMAQPYGSQALDIAAERGNVPMMRMLLLHGMSVHGPSKDDEPLWRAIGTKQFASVAFLLAHGANPNMHDPVPDGTESALQRARRQNSTIVKMLKHAGAKK